MVQIKYEKCCGLDVHQKTVVACVLTSSSLRDKPEKEIRTFGTKTVELRNLGSWLKGLGVEKVLMESTGQYWCPVWNILEEFGLNLMVVNPQRIKGIPGRKTDQKDSEWIADLGRLDLVAGSYIPDSQIQDLRFLVRTRTKNIQTITQYKNRNHNILQRANIKLTTYLSDIYGGSGRKLIDALLAGSKITEKLVKSLVSKRCKASIKDLVESLEGTLTKSNRILLTSNFKIIDTIMEENKELDKAIEEITSQHTEIFFKLQTIPGVSKRTAEVIIAEVGSNVNSFKTVKMLTSWAGICPGSYESGGVRKHSHITHGNNYLKKALYQAGLVAGHSLSKTFSDLYLKISNKGSKKKAIIAVAHKILRIIYKIMSCETQYQENWGNQKLILASS